MAIQKVAHRERSPNQQRYGEEKPGRMDGMIEASHGNPGGALGNQAFNQAFNRIASGWDL